MRKVTSIYVILIFVTLLIDGALLTSVAQTEQTITIALDQFQQEQLSDEIFADFEQQFGVDVITVGISQDVRFSESPVDALNQDAIDEYLDDVNDYAEQADLLPFPLFNNSQLIVRAGAFMDLSPLINADADANLEDFDSATLQSFQFDGGIYGLPLTVSAEVIVYNRTAFDAVGLSYPDETWTLADFFDAGATLSQFDNEGNLTLPGFFASDARIFHYLENNQMRLVDDSTFPPTPSINTPANIDLIERWVAYRQQYYPDFSSGGVDFNFSAIPLSLNRTFLLNDSSNMPDMPEDADFEASLLPGGRGALDIQGAYGVSAGTANPELAYELLQYMTRTPEIASVFFGDRIARRSIRNADADNIISGRERDNDAEALIDIAIANAIPESELIYYTYLDHVINQASSENVQDVATILNDQQQYLVDLLTAIDDATDTNTIAVATPIPTPVLQANEIAINFGVEPSFGPLINVSLWNNAIDEFVAQNPNVEQIIFNSGFLDLEERIETQDCFYLGRNIVQEADLTQLLSVEPFIVVDLTIDLDNFVPLALEQMTRDGSIRAIPMSFVPNIIWYNQTLFEQAGLPSPSNEWTLSEFVDTLNALTTVTDNPPFRSESFGAIYIYQIIAAYGGQPIDYSTAPYTFQLEDPANVAAIRQALNLAKSDLIDYTPLATNAWGGGGSNQAIFDSFLSPNNSRYQNLMNGFGDERVVMFPRGIDYTPLSYELGGGYINANTASPEACYRWLSFISKRPELLSGLPAQVDLFAQATADIPDGNDVAALFQAFSEAMSSPNVVVMPIGTSRGVNATVGVTNFITINWINAAFDAYVLEDADLETALSQAQDFSDDYAMCIEGIAEPVIPIHEMDSEESQTYLSQFFQCAVDVDPGTEEQFRNMLSSGDDK